MRLAAASILIALFFAMVSPPVLAFDAIELVSAKRKAGELEAAIAEVRKMILESEQERHETGYDYLLCRLLEQKGDIGEAMGCYSGVAGSISPLAEYALWRQSRIAWQTGNLLLERILLKELDLYYPDSLLRTAARNRVARSAFESGEHSLALTELGRISPPRARAKPANEADMRQIRLYTARANAALGNMEMARGQFDALLSDGVNVDSPDNIALEAVREIDLIDRNREAESGKVAQLEDSEHMRRGWVYQFNRDLRAARSHYLAVVEMHPLSPFSAEAVYQIGRGFAQDLNFADAILWFERLIEQYPDSPPANDGLLQLASAYARVGKSRESIARYHLFIDKYPGHDRLDRAYLNPIDVLRDQNADTDALRRSKEAQEVFRGRTAEAQALFAEARIYISREEWDKAIDSLDRLLRMPNLGGSRVPGGTDRKEAAFLRGYCFEKLLRFDEAIETYLSIPDGRNEYYGWRSTERLRAIATSERGNAATLAARARLTSKTDAGSTDERRRSLQQLLRLSADDEEIEKIQGRLETAYSQVSGYGSIPGFSSIERTGLTKLPVTSNHAKKAEMLVALGLYDEAAAEAEASGLASGDRLNDLYLKGDRAYRGLGSAEPQWRNAPADFQVELMPADTVRVLYPAPYREALFREASARNVDPRFLLAIMRQETRFRPDAESVAGARGLMQFIPSTAERMAREAGIERFSNRELFDPEVSILFASIYTSGMFKMFPKQPAAVAAGYNGGEENMQRWLKRSRSNDMDRYVSEIAYSQTKDYVQKVMANYRVYLSHYDENLVLRPRGKPVRSLEF